VPRSPPAQFAPKALLRGRGSLPFKDMRVLPSTVHSFRSNAERKVFDLLLATDLGPNAFALHSLSLSATAQVLVAPCGLSGKDD